MLAVFGIPFNVRILDFSFLGVVETIRIRICSEIYDNIFDHSVRRAIKDIFQTQPATVDTDDRPRQAPQCILNARFLLWVLPTQQMVQFYFTGRRAFMMLKKIKYCYVQ